jgi:hypothetical protein
MKIVCCFVVLGLSLVSGCAANDGYTVCGPIAMLETRTVARVREGFYVLDKEIKNTGSSKVCYDGSVVEEINADGSVRVVPLDRSGGPYCSEPGDVFTETNIEISKLHPLPETDWRADRFRVIKGSGVKASAVCG